MSITFKVHTITRKEWWVRANNNYIDQVRWYGPCRTEVEATALLNALRKEHLSNGPRTIKEHHVEGDCSYDEPDLSRS